MQIFISEQFRKKFEKKSTEDVKAIQTIQIPIKDLMLPILAQAQLIKTETNKLASGMHSNIGK